MTLTTAEQERLYDLQRSGELYVRQPISDDPEQDAPLLPEERLILAAIADRMLAEPHDQPFGQLADGTPIMGTFDGTSRKGWRRMDCVHADDGSWSFTVDAAGYVAGGTSHANEPFYFEDVTIAQLESLRDFLNSNALERMQAVAVSWGRGDTQPPV